MQFFNAVKAHLKWCPLKFYVAIPKFDFQNRLSLTVYFKNRLLAPQK